jgi:hypothetical protein
VIRHAYATLAAAALAPVAGWAITTRLQTLARRYAHHPEHAEFQPDYNPALANIAAYLHCTRCDSRTPHEDHQDGTATCVICHYSRTTEAVTSRGQ